MKAEDIERMYYRYTQFRDAPTVPWSELSQHAKEAFASVCRACEQHGIERAKAGARLQDDPSRDDPYGGEFWFIDWSALDAEIAKENE